RIADAISRVSAKPALRLRLPPRALPPTHAGQNAAMVLGTTARRGNARRPRCAIGDLRRRPLVARPGVARRRLHQRGLDPCPCEVASGPLMPQSKLTFQATCRGRARDVPGTCWRWMLVMRLAVVDATSREVQGSSMTTLARVLHRPLLPILLALAGAHLLND